MFCVYLFIKLVKTLAIQTISFELIIGEGHEQKFVPRPLGHRLQDLQIPNLHGCFRVEDVGGLVHELGALHVGRGGNDFGLR